MTVVAIADRPSAFEIARFVDGDDVSLKLSGVALRLFVKHVVVVKDGVSTTESYWYRLMASDSPKSWLIRWEYTRDWPTADYAYPLAHVHFNGNFHNGTSADKLHVPTSSVGMGLVIRHLITDWNVKPRTDDWEEILQESAARGFDEPE